MRRPFSRLLVCAILGSLLGCSREPEIVPVESLSFPAILVIGIAPAGTKYCHARIVRDKDELGRMGLTVFSALSDTDSSDVPIVLDSGASAFEMRNIKGEKGGPWMMLDPNGTMPIQFTMVRHAKAGVEAARTRLESCNFLGRDLDPDIVQLRRQLIRQAQSMAEIVRILEKVPDRPTARPN